MPPVASARASLESSPGRAPGCSLSGATSRSARNAVEELSKEGEVSYVLADVSRRADCERMAATAIERNGGIDVLCANAGIYPSQRVADMTDEGIEEVSART